MMKSAAVIGVVYSRASKAVSRSFASSVAENSVRKASPNTAIPGVSESKTNSGAGILA